MGAAPVIDYPAFAQMIWPDWHLAMPAGNIEHIGWLAEARDRRPQLRHQRAARLEIDPQMRRARSQIAEKQVIRLHPELDEAPQHR
jgi:hypothetical protein